MTYRNDVAVTETQWERLHTIATDRMDRLGLTREGVYTAGGPSPSWLSAVKNIEGKPSNRHRKMLDALDKALRWLPGTAWGLVADDRSQWTSEMLETEHNELVDQDDDKVGNFAFAVAAALRLHGAEDRAQMMRQIADIIGLPDRLE